MKFIAALIIFLFPLTAVAHPGRTDSYGCHTCRTNCSSWGLSYGEYHCHRAKSLPQPEPPIRSHSDGTTEPAPDYAIPTSKTEIPKANNYSADIAQKKYNNSFWWWLIAAGVVASSIYLIKRKK